MRTACQMLITAPLLGLLALSPSITFEAVSAQEQKLVSEGINGYADAKNRAPVLTVSVERTTGGVKLLADAYQISPEYRDYPVKFEFFVNRQLFVTQYRSAGLTGPVGVDIGPDVGNPPFNFSVLATVVHPNRTFSSAVEGAVFATDLTTTFSSCTLTQQTGSGTASTETLYVGQSVSAKQEQNDIVTLSFRGEPQGSGEALDITATISVSGQTASGKVMTEPAGSTEIGDSSTVEVTGTATLAEGKLNELDLTSSDDTLTLKCS